MGNTPSSEQPQRHHHTRRTPQKLSKPRVGNHTSPSSLGSSQSPPSAIAARLSNPYILGSHPAFSAETIDSPAAQVLAKSSENVGLVGLDKDVEVQDGQPAGVGIRRSSTALGSPAALRRKGSDLAQSNTFDGVNRSRSAAHRQKWASMTSLVASDAPQSSSHPEQDATAAYGKSPTSSPKIPLDAAEISRRNSHQQQAMDALLGRSHSETSLYAPARRRSVVQTPGVATRAGQSETSLSSRRSFRKSADPASEGKRISVESSAQKHLSMPSRPKMEETSDRAATPSDMDYKQIGGVKFGSLRITNASPVPTPGSEPQSDPMSPAVETLKADTTLLSPGDIIHPRPQSAAPVSPKLLNATESFADDAESSNDCSPFSQQGDGVSPFTVGTEPSAQTTPDEGPNMDPVDVKALGITDKKVARSDSGFGSSSSAENGKDPFPKPERSLSSTLSIRNLFGSRKASKKSKRNTTTQAAQSQADDKRPGLKPSVPYHSPPTETPPTLSQTNDVQNVEDGVAGQEPLSRRSSFLGSFKSPRSKESKEPKSPLALHARGKSMPGLPSRNVPVENPASSEASAGGQTPKKLQKLVTDVRRQSMPSVFQRQQRMDDIPSMPTDAAEKLQAHNRMYAQGSRGSFQAPPPGLRPASMVRTNPVDLPNVPARPTARRQPSDRPPRPKSTGPFIYGPGRPPSQVSSRPPQQRRSILRKPKREDEDGNDSDEGDALPDYVMGYEAQAASIDSIRKSAGNSAFDAAFVPMAEDNVMGTAGRSQPHGPMQKASSGRPKYPRLRTRSSAPDFLETVSEPADPLDPGSVDCYSQKKPKTPPPISIRTRGSKKKKKRRMPPSSSHGARHPPQHPPMPDRNRSPERRASVGPEQDLTQSLRSMPLPRPSVNMRPNHFEGARRGSEQGQPAANRRNSARPFYPVPISPLDDDQMGRYPVHPPASARDPPGEDTQQPPFRVLHSYNSPAYKGVPIWG